MLRHFTAALVILSVMLLGAGLAPAAYLTYVDLGVPAGGYDFSTGEAVNSSGVVASFCRDSSSVFNAHSWSGGTWTSLGDLGYGHSRALGINDSGVAVGRARNASSKDHAVIFSGGSATDIGLSGASRQSYANDINTSGVVVGQTQLTSSLDWHVFSHSGGTTTNLGRLGGTGTDSYAYGINDSGQIVGRGETTPGGAFNAFRYTTGTWTNLGTLGGTSSEAYDINASGQVTGFSDVGGNNHAFLWTEGGGGMVDLHPTSGVYDVTRAYGINASGQVVGQANYASPSTDRAAFLYSGGVMIDLNTLIDPNSDWYLFKATDINDSGQITGYIKHKTSGDTHGFIMTIPEPSTLALLATGLLGLLCYAWRKRK